jgi:hypothetical protein
MKIASATLTCLLLIATKATNDAIDQNATLPKKTNLLVRRQVLDYNYTEMITFVDDATLAFGECYSQDDYHDLDPDLCFENTVCLLNGDESLVESFIGFFRDESENGTFNSSDLVCPFFYDEHVAINTYSEIISEVLRSNSPLNWFCRVPTIFRFEVMVRFDRFHFIVEANNNDNKLDITLSEW